MKGVSDIPKYFLSDLCIADTIALYTILGVTLVIKWAVRSISTIGTIISRWWVNNSSVIRRDVRANISAATIT